MASIFKKFDKRGRRDNGEEVNTGKVNKTSDVQAGLVKVKKENLKGEIRQLSDMAGMNRQKVLILCSRGVTYRHRHLLMDLHSMMPHSRKEAKLDTKTRLYQLNELADLYNCNNIVFFEARKARDLYMWISRAPNGPTVKMHVRNLHTMDELNFTGNCLKGSRPILSFDIKFEISNHFKVLREILTQTFGVPPGAKRVKPFIDHVLSFTILNGDVWVRCYEIREEYDLTNRCNHKHSRAKSLSGTTSICQENSHSDIQKSHRSDVKLIEIGPRFVLTPIIIMESSFCGPVIYENREFVSPNTIRSMERKTRAAHRK